MIIRIHNQSEIEAMRRAGKMASQLLRHLGSLVRVGISTKQLDDAAVLWAEKNGVINAPLKYAPDGMSPFPASICTSVNSVICHGIPSEKDILKDGDIVNIDVTPILDGWHGDTSETFLVGACSDSVKNLVNTTKEALWKGIEAVHPGGWTGDIGAAIQQHVEPRGYSIVREFVGHGTGQTFHTEPHIFHFGDRGTGALLRAGMIFTIEPMVNMGRPEPVMKTPWIAVTKDGNPSAQFEHTILVTETGFEILTL